MDDFDKAKIELLDYLHDDKLCGPLISLIQSRLSTAIEESDKELKPNALEEAQLQVYLKGKRRALRGLINDLEDIATEASK